MSASDHRADAHRRHAPFPTPRRRPASCSRDHRPERAPRAPEHVPDRRREHERPDPGQRAEHAPAFAQVGEERAAPRAARAPAAAARARNTRAERERRRVDGQRPARPDDRDQHARDRRADDLAARQRGRAHAVGLLQIRSAGTIAGSSPVAAGLKKPVAAPVAPDSTASIQISADARDQAAPRSRSAVTSRTRSATTITARRDTRSATTPPISSVATIGSIRHASTMPDLGRRAAELEHRERERDRRPSRSPRCDTACAPNSSRKSRSRSTPTRPG